MPHPNLSGPSSSAAAPWTSAEVGRSAPVVTGCLLLFLAFEAAARRGDVFAGVGGHLLPGWILAFLLACGVRYAPVLFLGAVVSGLWLDPLPAPTAVVLAWALVVTLGSAVGATVLRHVLRADPRLRRLRDLNGLVLVMLVAPLPVAAAGTAVLAAARVVPASESVVQAVDWWIADAIGMLTLTPFLLVHVIPRARTLLTWARTSPARAAARRRSARPGPRIETILQAAGLGLAVWVPFGSVVAHHVQLIYAAFVPLIWIALRRGLGGAAAATVCLNLGIVFAVRATRAWRTDLADLQLLMLALALTGLFLGAAVNERRRAEAALRGSEAGLRALFEQALDAVVLVDSAGQFVDANPAACALLGAGREAIVGRGVFEFVAPRQVAAARVAWLGLLEQGEQRGMLCLRRADGGTREIEYSAKANVLPGRHLSILRDVTERRHLESQIRQSQKVEAVGRLAGGIAHEFNNLLAVILGYAETLLQDLTDEELREDAEEIRTAGERAAALTRQLLAFSRRQVLVPAVIDLNAVLADMDAMLRELLGDERELLIVSGWPPGRVRGDPGQLQHLILNLAMNACDAMPHGGRLTVETENVTLDEEFARRTPGTAPGAYVKLSVSDTGPGIPPAAQAHLFEPFFTTKPVGQGAGLGLGAVYGIARQHRGAVIAESKPGQGSTFAVYLPRVSEEPARAELAPVAAAGGSETILLVDDDPTVRERLLARLAPFGYTVLEAASSEEALFMAECHREPIHLLVTAIVMPEISGLELARRLTAVRSELRVLYVGADGTDGLTIPAGRAPAAPIVSAATPPESLARAVRDALAGRVPRAQEAGLTGA